MTPIFSPLAEHWHGIIQSFKRGLAVFPKRGGKIDRDALAFYAGAVAVLSGVKPVPERLIEDLGVALVREFGSEIPKDPRAAVAILWPDLMAGENVESAPSDVGSS